GICGVLLASWGTTLLSRWPPDDIPRMPSVRFDPAVLAFNLVLTILTGIFIGLLPALQSWRMDHSEAIQQSSRTVKGSSPRRIRDLLVASQVCIAFVLTVGSGLLLKSFMLAWNVDPGFQVQNLYEVNFAFLGPKYQDDQTVQRAQSEVLDRVQHLAGVQCAGLVSTPPLAGNFGGYDQAGFHIQDRRVSDPEAPSVDRYIVDAGYFRTMGIPILRGRTFADTDTFTTEHVAVISEMVARQIFAGEDPIGRRIQLGGRHEDRPWATIVGVVGNVHQYGLDSPVTPQAYLLYSQQPFNYATVLLVRSSIDSKALTRAIKEQIWAVDKGTVVFNPAWMTEILAHSLAARRFTMSLLTAFGFLAVILAAVGIYGVMSYMVTQRTDEIGVRMALGAQALDMLRLVANDGMLRAGVGLFVGFILSLA